MLEIDRMKLHDEIDAFFTSGDINEFDAIEMHLEVGSGDYPPQETMN